MSENHTIPAFIEVSPDVFKAIEDCTKDELRAAAKRLKDEAAEDNRVAAALLAYASRLS